MRHPVPGQVPWLVGSALGVGLVVAAFTIDGWLFAQLLAEVLAVVGAVLATVAGLRLTGTRLTPLRACLVPLGVLAVITGLIVYHSWGAWSEVLRAVGNSVHVRAIAATAGFPFGVALARERWWWAWAIASAAAVPIVLFALRTPSVYLHPLLAVPLLVLAVLCTTAGYLLSGSQPVVTSGPTRTPE